MMQPISIAVEGPTDAAVLTKILVQRGLPRGAIYIKGGCAGIDSHINGYNKAAQRAPWIVLRDLDLAECAPSLARDLLPNRAKYMCFSIAVRAVEAWLLADALEFSRFLAVSEALICREPESITDPKCEIINLARRSRKRAIRDALVPAPGSTAKVGPGYVGIIGEFATGAWNPESAAKRCPSLTRLLRFLDDLIFEP